MEKADGSGWTPLMYACYGCHIDSARYLLEQGANRDKATPYGETILHFAADHEHLELTKLLMVYGADLNARNRDGHLPIDFANSKKIKKAILDEPRRRMDHGHKRATEQDRHPNAAVSASAQQEEVGEDNEDAVEQSNKRPRLEERVAMEEGKVADEDQDSEPSDEEDD